MACHHYRRVPHLGAGASTLRRLLASAGIENVNGITADLIRAALGRIVASGKSAGTANHAMSAACGFSRWLHEDAKRLKENPLIGRWKKYSEDADVRHERRDLSIVELARLLEAATRCSPIIAVRPNKKSRRAQVMIDGPERAMANRIAMGTEFRASEIRSSTPESFDLGPEPTITVRAAYTKNDKDAVQLIRHDLADLLRPWLAKKELGKPGLVLPEKTAKMLRVDLAAAGIPYETKDGVVNFHGLRASYIRHLIESGASPKTVQELGPVQHDQSHDRAIHEDR